MHLLRIVESMNAQTILFLNQKKGGGVGKKTTSAVNLGAALAGLGKKSPVDRLGCTG